MTDEEKIKTLEADAKYWREESEKNALKAQAFQNEADAIKAAGYAAAEIAIINEPTALQSHEDAISEQVVEAQAKP